MVIALTHMRNSDDEELAKQVKGIDLILGGH
jgi:2',3'-cyclic-nucleotide 2'-phosphodiesterase (5'-nucleotidase family)